MLIERKNSFKWIDWYVYTDKDQCLAYDQLNVNTSSISLEMGNSMYSMAVVMGYVCSY